MSEQQVESNDFIVSELLSELKTANARKDQQIATLHRNSIVQWCACAFVVLLTIAAFLWYLSNYDFTSNISTINNAEGLYTIVDSDGNVIASDITPQDIEKLMEAVVDGEDSIVQGQIQKPQPQE